MSDSERWTEGKVFDALSRLWPSPAHVRLCSVRNGTGYSRKQARTADGVVFSTWPSRGLWMAGVEIKVSRADWRRELANAEKSAEIQQYCNYWWVAAPAGVVPIGELPETWGLVEVGAKSASVTKQAPRLEAKPPDILMVCAIFRSIDGKMTPTATVDELVRRAREEAEKAAKEAKKTPRDYELERLKECVAKFEKASGVTIAHQWDAGKIGEAVALVRRHGASTILSRMRQDAKWAKEQAEEVLSRLAAIGSGDVDDSEEAA
jgi:hypothetical protein